MLERCRGNRGQGIPVVWWLARPARRQRAYYNRPYPMRSARRGRLNAHRLHQEKRSNETRSECYLSRPDVRSASATPPKEGCGGDSRDSRGIAFCASKTYVGSTSIPTPLYSSASQAASVEPLPAKGSRIVPSPRGSTARASCRRKACGSKLGCGASDRSSARVGLLTITSLNGPAGRRRRPPFSTYEGSAPPFPRRAF